MNIEEIFKKPKLWLAGKAEGDRADLRGANLQDENLRCSNLRNTNLQDADLRETNLRRADLREADLRGSNLRGADLRGSNLRGVNLRHAALQDVETDKPIIQIVGSKHTLLFLDGTLQIGCERMPLDEWMEKFEELAKKEGYSDAEIAEYRRYIEMLRSFEEAT